MQQRVTNLLTDKIRNQMGNLVVNSNLINFVFIKAFSTSLSNKNPGILTGADLAEALVNITKYINEGLSLVKQLKEDLSDRDLYPSDPDTSVLEVILGALESRMCEIISTMYELNYLVFFIDPKLYNYLEKNTSPSSESPLSLFWEDYQSLITQFNYLKEKYQDYLNNNFNNFNVE